MNKDFLKYTAERCNEACISNKEYRRLQSKGCDLARTRNFDEYEEFEELANEIEAVSSRLCYIQGFKDALLIMAELKGEIRATK